MKIAILAPNRQAYENYIPGYLNEHPGAELLCVCNVSDLRGHRIDAFVLIESSEWNEQGVFNDLVSASMQATRPNRETTVPWATMERPSVHISEASFANPPSAEDCAVASLCGRDYAQTVNSRQFESEYGQVPPPNDDPITTACASDPGAQNYIAVDPGVFREIRFSTAIIDDLCGDDDEPVAVEPEHTLLKKKKKNIKLKDTGSLINWA